jgi:hypothetical protein
VLRRLGIRWYIHSLPFHESFACASELPAIHTKDTLRPTEWPHESRSHQAAPSRLLQEGGYWTITDGGLKLLVSLERLDRGDAEGQSRLEADQRTTNGIGYGAAVVRAEEPTSSETIRDREGAAYMRRLRKRRP